MWWWDDDAPAEEGYLRRLSLREMLRRVVPRLRPHRRLLLLATGLMLVSVGAELLRPILLRHLIDQDIPGATRLHQSAPILRTVFLYLGVFLLGNGAGFWQACAIARMGLRVVTRLKLDTFRHLMTLGMDYFDGNPPGRLLARVESDAEKLQMLFSEFALAFLRVLIMLAGTLTIMLRTNWRVTLAIFAFVTFLAVLVALVLRFMRKLNARVRKLWARLSTFVTEYVQAVPILQAFGRTDWSLGKLQSAQRARYSAEVRTEFFQYGFMSLFGTMEIVLVMMILWMGLRSRLQAGMTLGTLILFVEYTRMVFFPVLMFAEQFGFLQRSFASADRVFGILDTQSSVVDPPGAVPPVPADWREISYEDVTFSYDGQTRALENVSFRVRRGERIALAGPSGGGKSTVTSLLLRFYEPTSGRITLDGVDIRDYALKDWRNSIGLVLQDIHLFPGSVGDNLRVFTDEIPEEALTRSIRAIGAEDILARLPGGFAANLAEGGQNLSMGERQLISFARAVVRDPQLLVLDEATSSVDPGTEHRLQESLGRLQQGRTSLVVAHRLSTITTADRILVLHHGRLVEEGSHEDLYRQGGLYRGLFDLQFQAGEAV